MRIRFTETRVVDDCRKGTPDEERYAAGKEYDLPERSAQRWVGRGVAEIVASDGLKEMLGAAARGSERAPAEVQKRSGPGAAARAGGFVRPKPTV